MPKDSEKTRICFRGDSRKPNEIFTKGFSSRKKGPIKYRENVDRAGDVAGAGDIHPDTAVCVSARISGASMFPLKFAKGSCPEKTFIYLVGIDTGDVTNTHKIQVLDGLEGIDNNSSSNTASVALDALWPVFAHELAVKDIPANRIIAAVECARKWNGSEWDDGGTYELLTVHENPACSIGDEYIDAALEFLKVELKNHKKSDMPDMSKGFAVSEQS